MYPNTELLIDGAWGPGATGAWIDVVNPATGDTIGQVAHAQEADLERAVQAAAKAFASWRTISAYDRSKLMRKAADLVRERAETIATILTTEQGKPIGEAKIEVMVCADTLDWFAEEARRTYGRLIPARRGGVHQMVIKEPVGVVAAFTPWNFPLNQVVRKVGAAMAAGCSIIVKASEETPASAAALIRALIEAGVPSGVVNLVFGVPADISNYLIPHPAVRKVSFTGSVPVGKQLAALAGQHMKRVTMELGGHAPAIVFDDADIGASVAHLAGSKFRNAGQVCIAPTRFLVHEKVYDSFLDKFIAAAKKIKVGDGLETDTKMGPLINQRRVQAIEDLVADAEGKGGTVTTGGHRIGNKGSFYEPTVVTDVTRDMRAMNEEPFGPVALVRSFRELEEAVEEANRLPFGLAAYAYSRSTATTTALSERIETGMLTMNHVGLALPETPFGGVKDSGYGSEGGLEGVEAYLNTKFVTQAAA